MKFNAIQLGGSRPHMPKAPLPGVGKANGQVPPSPPPDIRTLAQSRKAHESPDSRAETSPREFIPDGMLRGDSSEPTELELMLQTLRQDDSSEVSETPLHQGTTEINSEQDIEVGHNANSGHQNIAEKSASATPTSERSDKFTPPPSATTEKTPKKNKFGQLIKSAKKSFADVPLRMTLPNKAKSTSKIANRTHHPDMDQVQRQQLNQHFGRIKRQLGFEQALTGRHLQQFKEAVNARREETGKVVAVESLMGMYMKHVYDKLISESGLIPAYALDSKFLTPVRYAAKQAFVQERLIHQRKWQGSPDAPPMDLTNVKDAIAVAAKQVLGSEKSLHDKFEDPPTGYAEAYLDSPVFTKHCTELSVHLSNDASEQAQGVIHTMGVTLAMKYEQSSNDQKLAYSTCFGDTLRSAIASALRQQGIHNKGGGQSGADPLANRIFHATVSQMSNIRQHHLNDDQGRAKLIVGNTVFSYGNALGNPSAGRVDTYVSGTQLIAVKSTRKIDAKGFGSELNMDSAIREARIHFLAQGEGNPHVITLLGAKRSADGKHFDMALELAHKGDARRILNDLNQAPTLNAIQAAAGNLPPKAVQRHLFHGMLSGIAHCHQNGIAHLDVKPENFFMDDKLLVKLGDFGTGHLIDHSTLHERPPTDTFVYQPPECVRLRERFYDVGQKISATVNAFMEGKSKTERQLQTAYEVRNLMHADPKDFTLTEKVDMWSLGMILYEMERGDSITDPESAFNLATADQLLAYQNLTPAERADKLKLNPTLPMDQLILDLLSPEPTQRPSAQDVLKSGLFQPLNDAVTSKIQAAVDNLREAGD